MPEDHPEAAQSQGDPDPAVNRRLYGKFRGTVVNNVDPFGQGRLMVSVPGVVLTGWAMPCVPVTDILMGTFTRPRIGANVWIEFERGDPDKPIWVGCYWGIEEVPPLAKAASVSVPPTNTVITMETATSGISVCDVPILAANVMIQAGAGVASIMLTPAGVVITAPSVTITAPVVSIAAAAHFTVASPNFNVI